MAAWPRRRGSRRNSGEPTRAAVAYRALSAGTGRNNGVLGRRWSYHGGAGVARHELRAAMVTAERWALGGCCCEEEKAPGAKWERGMARAGAGDVKARSGAAWPARSGQRRRAAVAGDTRRANSAVGRPLNASFSFVRNTMAEPDSAIST